MFINTRSGKTEIESDRLELGLSIYQEQSKRKYGERVGLVVRASDSGFDLDLSAETIFKGITKKFRHKQQTSISLILCITIY